MFDIFFSYANRDFEQIRPIISALEKSGFSVFWDRTTPAGKAWRDYIYDALKDAKCTVVAWSRNSIKSEWVIEEADIGKRKANLVPVRIDDSDPPFGFGSIQTSDLRMWKEDVNSEQYKHFILSVRGIVSPSLRGAEKDIDKKNYTNKRYVSHEVKPDTAPQKKINIKRLVFWLILALGIVSYYYLYRYYIKNGYFAPISQPSGIYRNIETRNTEPMISEPPSEILDANGSPIIDLKKSKKSIFVSNSDDLKVIGGAIKNISPEGFFTIQIDYENSKYACASAVVKEQVGHNFFLSAKMAPKIGIKTLELKGNSVHFLVDSSFNDYMIYDSEKNYTPWHSIEVPVNSEVNTLGMYQFNREVIVFINYQYVDSFTLLEDPPVEKVGVFFKAEKSGSEAVLQKLSIWAF